MLYDSESMRRFARVELGVDRIDDPAVPAAAAANATRLLQSGVP